MTYPLGAIFVADVLDDGENAYTYIRKSIPVWKGLELLKVSCSVELIRHVCRPLRSEKFSSENLSRVFVFLMIVYGDTHCCGV